jgi:ribosome maturation factor RimP
MEYRDSAEDLTKIISSFLEEEGAELVEMKLTRSEGKTLLRLLIDNKSGGITLGECLQLNRRIGEMLENSDLIKESYILEVSSPGLDRPLTSRNDFLRSKEKRVRFFFKELVDGKVEFEGKVLDLDLESVIIEAGGKVFAVPLSNINRAKYII